MQQNQGVGFAPCNPLLSVSSAGSEAMQHSQALSDIHVALTFSILGRIGGDATLNPLPRPRRPPRLSVSSAGSEAMQRGSRVHPVSRLGPVTFSILGRIGGDATRCWRQRGRASRSLSVSSVGSEAMQLNDAQKEGPTASDFQYPRSDRRRCNVSATLWQRAGGCLFQYPRSDRRRCN